MGLVVSATPTWQRSDSVGRPLFSLWFDLVMCSHCSLFGSVGYVCRAHVVGGIQLLGGRLLVNDSALP